MCPGVKLELMGKLEGDQSCPGVKLEVMGKWEGD